MDKYLARIELGEKSNDNFIQYFRAYEEKMKAKFKGRDLLGLLRGMVKDFISNPEFNNEDIESEIILTQDKKYIIRRRTLDSSGEMKKEYRNN